MVLPGDVGPCDLAFAIERVMDLAFAIERVMDLAFAIERVMAGYISLDLITGELPDAGRAERQLRLLLRSTAV